MKYGDKTGFKDINSEDIYIGDVVSVEEYPGEYVGGSLDYEGVIEWDESINTVVVVYYDIGERDSMPLSYFLQEGRKLLKEWQRKDYWKSLMLGAEPPKRLYKRENYHEQNAIHELVDNMRLGISYADYAFCKREED